MAQQVELLTFEEGTAGATVDADTAIRKPAKWDDTDSSLTILRTRYTVDSHGGALAAAVDQSLGGGSILVQAAAPYASGGGGWVKSSTPPSFDGDPIASVGFSHSNPSYTRGVGIYHNAGNLEARFGPTVFDSIPYVADRWMHLTLSPGGTWVLADPAGVTLMSGSVAAAEASPYEHFTFFAQAGSTPGAAIVDDVTLWWQADGPVVRLYPRDDGRGMSSAPRIIPAAKGRSRIIGGFQ